MSQNNENFENTIQNLYKGMNTVVSTKTIVGDPIYIDDITIIPLMGVSFGMAAGAFNNDSKGNKNGSAGGMGGKIYPSAMLVIHNGITRMISVDRNSAVEKLLDLLPDFVDKFATKVDGKKQNKDARAKAAKKMEDIINEAFDEEEEEADDLFEDDLLDSMDEDGEDF